MPADLYADDAIDGTADAPDRLGRRPYARHLVTLLDRISRTSRSSVLALIGPWGSGKSSVLGMTLAELRTAETWRIAEFNPWAYADLNAMLVGFFEELITALPERSRPPRLRETVGSWVVRLSPLGKAAGAFGVDAEGATAGLGRLVAGDTSPSAQQRKLAAALDAAGQKVLVVLDDLDRLAPVELLLVFKLVRFVGRLPHVHYLMSYDERTLLDVLARTDLCGGDEARARDYLEKIVQVRLDIPPLREAQARHLAHAGMRALAAGLGAPMDEGRFASAYETYLGLRLNTPRAINRYLVQVDALFALLADEVDFVDFALLTFLRTFEPALYATVHRARRELTELQHGWRDEDVDRWRSLVRLTQAPDEDALLGFLRDLFPRDRAAGDLLAADRRLGHRDYTDRYFSFGVPDDEMSDARLHEVLAKLPEMTPGDPARQELKLALLIDTDRVLRRIRLRRPRTPGVTTALVALLTDCLDERPTRQRIAGLATALATEDPGAWSDRFGVLIGHRNGLILAPFLLGKASGLGAEEKDAVVGWIYKRLQDRRRDSFLTLPSDVYEIVLDWGTVDPASCRVWMQGGVRTGSWPVLDVVGRLIVARGPGEDATLDQLDESAVDNVIGLDFVLAELGRAVDTAEQPDEHGDTPENRRRASLWLLRGIRDERSRRIREKRRREREADARAEQDWAAAAVDSVEEE